MQKTRLIRRKKPNIHYDLDIGDKNDYELTLYTTLSAGRMARAANWILKKAQIQAAEPLPSFCIDERYHPKVIKRVRGAINEAELKMRKKYPDFKIVPIKVDDFIYERKGPIFQVTLKLIGSYVLC
jgi:hypothetical protein